MRLMTTWFHLVIRSIQRICSIFSHRSMGIRMVSRRRFKPRLPSPSVQG